MKTGHRTSFLVLTLITLMQIVRFGSAQDVPNGPLDQQPQPGGMEFQGQGVVVMPGQQPGMNNGPVMFVVPNTALDPNAMGDQSGQDYQGGQQDMGGGQPNMGGRRQFNGGGNPQQDPAAFQGRRQQQQDQQQGGQGPGGGRMGQQDYSGNPRGQRNRGNSGYQRSSILRPGSSLMPIDPKSPKIEMFLGMKNIFDPQRREERAAPPPTPTPIPTERVALTGVLIDGNTTPKKAVAIFEGSRDEYNSNVEPGGIIAGQRLIEVLSDRVKLEGKTITELPISCQMTRQGQGDWTVTSTTMLALNTGESSFIGRRPQTDFGGGAGGNQFGGGGRGGRFGGQQDFNGGGQFGGPFGGGGQFGGGGGRGGRNRQFGGGGQQDFGGGPFGGGGGRGGRFGGGQDTSVVINPTPVTSSGTPATSSATPAVSQDELIKQMMERRKKEMGQ